MVDKRVTDITFTAAPIDPTLNSVISKRVIEMIALLSYCYSTLWLTFSM